MTDLTADAWISSNSEIAPERLHAIGVVSFQWNHCEFWLFQLFCGIAELSDKKAWALVYDLGDVAISTRINVLMQTRGFHANALILIKNALEFYDRCRQNRNSIVHAWTQGSGHWVKMVRKGKDPSKMPSEQFPCELEDVRRVAVEIQWLSRRLWILACLYEDGSFARAMPSPRTLPLPDVLWKPLLPPNIESLHPPKSSQASPRRGRSPSVLRLTREEWAAKDRKEGRSPETGAE
jgi:hypothetical protein